MVESSPSRASTILIFALLGPPLAMAIAMAEMVVKGLMMPGDMSIAISLVVIGSNPLGLLEPLAILALPLGLTGLLAVMGDSRLNPYGFSVVCAAAGTLFTLLSTPLLGASPDLTIGIAGGLAGFGCAMATRIHARLMMRR